MVLLWWSCCHGLIVVAIVIFPFVSAVVRVAFIVTVISIFVAVGVSIVVVSRLHHGSAATASQRWAQQWQRRWWCSDGDRGAAMAMEVQRWLRRRSSGNGDGGAAMGVAVVEVTQQWGWTEAVVSCILFLSNKLISFVAYVGPIQTGLLY